MLPRTILCDLLSIAHPIVQAPIGSATSADLAAAVSNAGGLGSLALSWRSPAEIARIIEDTRALTPHPFAVNVVLEWPQGERVRAAIEHGVRIVWTFWGDPADVYREARAAGALCIHTVGSEAETARAADAGAHAIVVQGVEAGGHVRATSPLREVLAAVLRSTDLPVIAAGGIVTGGDIAGLLRAGAAGVCLGTRFLCTHESAVADSYKQTVVGASAGDTVLTTLFDGGWPDAPHRVIRNSTYRAWEAAGRPPTGQRPGEGEIIARMPGGAAVTRYDDAIPVRGVTGSAEALAMYAGTSAGAIHEILPAAEVVRRLVSETEMALSVNQGSGSR